MKRKIFIILTSLICLYIEGPAQDRIDQQDRNTFRPGSAKDSSNVDSKTIPVGLFQWTVDRQFGTIIPRSEVDTTLHRFQNLNFTEGMTGNYSTLANMGAPRLNRIFANRKEHQQFMFTEHLDFYMKTPDEIVFSNTKSPFTNLTYFTCGDKNTGEDRVKAYFATNINKQAGFGFTYDYLYGRGYYANQSTSYMKGTIWGYYHGDHYQMHIAINNSHLKNAENGGITDETYILHPENISQSFSSQDIPVALTKTWNRNNQNAIFLTHRFNLGFDKEIIDNNDTTKIKSEFIPVSSFIHTLELKDLSHTYLSYSKNAGIYTNDYLGNDSTNDVTRNFAIKNTFAISLREGFNKYAMAGITAFISHELRQFKMVDSIGKGNFINNKYKENIVRVGGQLLKEQGHTFHYDITGGIALTGPELGSFSLDGKGDMNLKIGKDSVRLDLRAYVKNETPAFFYRQFHSKYIWWDNDLSKEFRSRAQASLTLSRTRSKFSACFETIKNYTSFVADNTLDKDNKRLIGVRVGQADEQISVLTLTLNQDFKVGIFNWENELTYQNSSSDAIPVPTFNAFSNLYMKVKLAKVLSIELGGAVRYFTEYKAPYYSPQLMQFYTQGDDTNDKVGNYPIIDLYANCHLKHTRFFIMMNHFNAGSGSRRYFNFTKYPMNPQIIRFGVSWNFFD